MTLYYTDYKTEHHNGTLLCDSLLPIYQEWKQSRPVKFRNAAIKRIDDCLKACNESVHFFRALCYNCLLLCYDIGQNFEYDFPGCQAPEIGQCTFNVGPYSILGCWELFELGASPSNDCVAQFLCHAEPDLRRFDKEQRKQQYTLQIIKKYQLYCLAEHIQNNILKLQFGVSFEWRKITSQFSEKCDKKILNTIDAYTYAYYLNPKVDDLASVSSDIGSKILVASKRKIICEPILWLIYVRYCLLDRQKKLQELVLSSYGFADNATKVKGQKLKTIIENLGKKAREESDKLRKITVWLPTLEDLQTTFELEIMERDPKVQFVYTRSFNKGMFVLYIFFLLQTVYTYLCLVFVLLCIIHTEFFVSTKTNMTDI